MAKTPLFKRPPGTQDILPEEVPLWRKIEQTARELFSIYGYEEIRTPLLENIVLFERSIGETTDIVEKEMFVFSRGDDTLVLRPEATAGVVRAYIEHALHGKRKFRKLYYIGAMFRYERPQAGRRRQFHQLGVEAIGSTDPLLDVETIKLASHILDALSIQGYEIKLNMVGCETCRPPYRELLLEKARENLDALCSDCRRRVERNPFRIFDCKKESCPLVFQGVPPLVERLCEECEGKFTRLLDGLKLVGLEFTLDNSLFRGFDYYTGLVYEITHNCLGAQNAVCGGGRYDRLVARCGGPDMGAVGFAEGIERIMMLLKESDGQKHPPIFIASVGQTRRECFRFANILRQNGISCELDFEGRSLKAQMREANRLESPFVIIVGEEELKEGKFTLRDMTTGKEEKLDEGSLLSRFASQK